MAKASSARVPCPKCSTKLPWRPEYAGRVATCKACSTKLRMPKSPAESPLPVRANSGKKGAAAAKRQKDAASDDPYAFLDDDDMDAEAFGSPPPLPGGSRRRKGSGQRSSGGGSIKCPSCGANCAPNESSCPLCDQSLSTEVLEAHQAKASRKTKKKREPRERILPEIYILGVGFEKILIAVVLLAVVGFFTIPPLLNKIEEMNSPQPFYKVVKLGAADRLEIFDASGKFVNAMDFTKDGLKFQHGGEHKETVEVELEPVKNKKRRQPVDGEEVEEEDDDEPEIMVVTTVTMNPDVVMKFSGWQVMIRVQEATFGGKNMRQKYDNGQFSQ